MLSLAEKVPATVLTGFLGAGKTTLLNHILTARRDGRIAVVVNEFGEVGIDHQLLARTDEDIVEMNNGCICCQVRGDLVNAFDRLLTAYDDIEHVLIETTGLADPAPIIQSFMIDDRVAQRLRLDAIVTLVDARHLHHHLDGHEAQEQIAFADIIVINKADLVSPEELDSVERKVLSINGFAARYTATHAHVDIDCILGTNRFHLANALRVEPNLLIEEGHEHDPSVTSISITREGVLDAKRFSRWTFELGQEYSRNLFRVKGVLNIENSARRFVFHGVHMTFDGRPGKPWRDEPRTNQLVIIGRHLDKHRIEAGFAACMV